MKSIIRELYEGNISPMDKIISQDPKYGPIWDKIGREMEYLTGKLPPEDARRLEQLDDLYSEAFCMDTYEGFAYGLRLGMGMCREIFDRGV